jgi:hypothetical protein
MSFHRHSPLRPRLGVLLLLPLMSGAEAARANPPFRTPPIRVVPCRCRFRRQCRLEESNALDPELVGEVLSGDEDAAGEGTTTDA